MANVLVVRVYVLNLYKVMLIGTLCLSSMYFLMLVSVLLVTKSGYATLLLSPHTQVLSIAVCVCVHACAFFWQKLAKERGVF